MAVFYLLPPRSFLGDRLAALVQGVLPGIDCDVAARLRLVEACLAALGDRADVFVVFRDELPAGEAPGRALVDSFGAEPGDEVVEVRPGGRPGETVTSRWSIPLLLVDDAIGQPPSCSPLPGGAAVPVWWSASRN
jgi:hypothetical protein